MIRVCLMALWTLSASSRRISDGRRLGEIFAFSQISLATRGDTREKSFRKQVDIFLASVSRNICMRTPSSIP